MDANPSAVRLYDVSLRAGLWSPTVVTELLAMASVVKFSEAEAQELAPVLGLHWKGPKTLHRNWLVPPDCAESP